MAKWTLCKSLRNNPFLSLPDLHLVAGFQEKTGSVIFRSAFLSGSCRQINNYIKPLKQDRYEKRDIVNSYSNPSFFDLFRPVRPAIDLCINPAQGD